MQGKLLNMSSSFFFLLRFVLCANFFWFFIQQRFPLLPWRMTVHVIRFIFAEWAHCNGNWNLTKKNWIRKMAKQRKEKKKSVLFLFSFWKRTEEKAPFSSHIRRFNWSISKTWYSVFFLTFLYKHSIDTIGWSDRWVGWWWINQRNRDGMRL